MAYVDPRLRGKPAPSVSVEQMEKGHVARLAAMKGSELAFLDQRVPGYQREIINIIGMGVVENLDDPDLKPKIAAQSIIGAAAPSTSEPGRWMGGNHGQAGPEGCDRNRRGAWSRTCLRKAARRIGCQGRGNRPEPALV